MHTYKYTLIPAWCQCCLLFRVPANALRCYTCCKLPVQPSIAVGCASAWISLQWTVLLCSCRPLGRAAHVTRPCDTSWLSVWLAHTRVCAHPCLPVHRPLPPLPVGQQLHQLLEGLRETCKIGSRQEWASNKIFIIIFIFLTYILYFCNFDYYIYKLNLYFYFK